MDPSSWESTFRSIANFAACVCSKDGFLSQSEELMMLELLRDSFPNLTEEQFDDVLTGFFESELQIDDYLLAIEKPAERLLALKIAEKSASEDGLDLRENIALERAYIMWGMTRDA